MPPLIWVRDKPTRDKAMNVMWRAGASLATICAMAVFVNCAAAQDPMRPNPSRYKPGDIVILNRDIDDNGMSGLEFAERAGAPLVGQVCHMVIKKGTALRVADTDDFHAGAIFNLTHDGQPTRDVRMFPDSDLDPALKYSTDNIIDPIPLTGCRSFADVANEENQKTANLELAAIVATLGIGSAGLFVWATAGGGISRYRSKKSQRLSERARAHAAAVQAREDEARYVERWPAARFPRLSPKTATEKELWDAYLARWPAPPKTERERAENEKKFWNMALDRFTVDTSSGPELIPKQTILDDFLAIDDAWLRSYYAATGTYHEPYDGPEMRRANR